MRSGAFFYSLIPPRIGRGERFFMCVLDAVLENSLRDFPLLIFFRFMLYPFC